MPNSGPRQSTAGTNWMSWEMRLARTSPRRWQVIQWSRVQPRLIYQELTSTKGVRNSILSEHSTVSNFGSKGLNSIKHLSSLLLLYGPNSPNRPNRQHSPSAVTTSKLIFFVFQIDQTSLVLPRDFYLDTSGSYDEFVQVMISSSSQLLGLWSHLLEALLEDQEEGLE